MKLNERRGSTSLMAAAQRGGLQATGVAHHQVEAGRVLLRDRQIDHRVRDFHHGLVLHIRDHANDGHPGFLTVEAGPVCRGHPVPARHARRNLC